MATNVLVLNTFYFTHLADQRVRRTLLGSIILVTLVNADAEQLFLSFNHIDFKISYMCLELIVREVLGGMRQSMHGKSN